MNRRFHLIKILFAAGLSGLGVLHLSMADDQFLRDKLEQSVADCRVPRARELLAQISDPAMRAELGPKVERVARDQERVNGLFQRANQAYTDCDYTRAGDLLEQAIYAPGCRRIRQQLSEKLHTLLGGAYTDYEVGHRWNDLRQRMAEAREHFRLMDMRRLLHLVAQLKGQARCDTLNQRIGDYHAQLEQAYSRLEVENRPYLGVEQALRMCRYDQAAERLKKVEPGPRKDKLEQDLQTMRALRKETNTVYKTARAAYAACHYQRALDVLTELRGKSMCGKIISQLDAKIERTQAMLKRDNQVRELLQQVRSDSKIDLTESYRKLSLAQRMNGCEVRGDSLRLILEKAREKLSPKVQLAVYDCSALANGEVYWDEQRGRPGCRCTEGYSRDESAACVADEATRVAALDCSPWPHSVAHWFDTAAEPACFCGEGYRWKADYSACIALGSQ